MTAPSSARVALLLLLLSTAVVAEAAFFAPFAPAGPRAVVSREPPVHAANRRPNHRGRRTVLRSSARVRRRFRTEGGALSAAADGTDDDGDDSSIEVHGDGESIGKSVVAFDWYAHWYPLSPVQDLSRSSPNRLTLLGIDVAVWYHEPSGTWRSFVDECPHRLVPLSEGRIEPSTGRLQCAYHGWEFEEDGSCARIPQLGSGEGSDAAAAAAVRSPRACCTSFPVRVEQGLVWVLPVPEEGVGEPSSQAASAVAEELPLIPQLDDPSFVDATNFFVRDMPYSWEVLVENLCDPSHIPFAHHGMMNGADRSDVDKIDIAVTEESAGGFRARKDPYPTDGGKYDVKFEAPCLLYYEMLAGSMKDAHRKNAGGGGAKEDDPPDDDENGQKKKTYIGLGTYCVPTTPGNCRIIARFPFRLSFPPVMWIIRRTPRWITHLSQNVVMDSDVVFLSSQDERLDMEEDRVRPGYYMPARCDAMVSAFRTWLGSHGGGGPRWMTGAGSGRGMPAAERSSGEKGSGEWTRPRDVPARTGRDALLDRYRQHTDVCSSCRGAYRALRRAGDVCYAAGVCLLAVAAAAAAGSAGGGNACACGFRRATAAAAAALLLVPRFVLRPIVSRMECAPWPRRGWVDAAPQCGIARWLRRSN